jgi:hypothetical protein
VRVDPSLDGLEAIGRVEEPVWFECPGVCSKLHCVSFRVGGAT